MTKAHRYKVLVVSLVLAGACLLQPDANAADARIIYSIPTPAAALPGLYARAEQGDPIAQLRLGVVHEKGLGVPQNFAEAARWYILAAEQGIAEAQFNLALMYRDGQGVSKSNMQAHFWLNIAQARYRPSEKSRRYLAIMLREGVAKRLTPDEVEESQRRASLWRPSQFIVTVREIR